MKNNMERRIKYIKKNSGWYYAVQIKIWIFWKTIYTDGIFANIEKFIDTLEQIDDFNSKAKSSNKYPSRSKKR
jgi:hypothetical protein